MNDKKKKEINEELEYLVTMINKYVKAWGAKNLVLIDKKTEEDTAFYFLYKNFEHLLPKLRIAKGLDEIDFSSGKEMLYLITDYEREYSEFLYYCSC